MLPDASMQQVHTSGTMSPRQKTKTGFFSLPLELRQHCYSEMLPTDRLLTFAQRRWNPWFFERTIDKVRKADRRCAFGRYDGALSPADVMVKFGSRRDGVEDKRDDRWIFRRATTSGTVDGRFLYGEFGEDWRIISTFLGPFVNLLPCRSLASEVQTRGWGEVENRFWFVREGSHMNKKTKRARRSPPPR